MQVIRGRIQRFLRGRAGEIHGLILDRGIEVRLPATQSNHASAIGQIGSYIEIHGWVRPGPAGGMQFEATAIVNPDSNQIICLNELPRSPEMPSFSTPTSEEAASLAPLSGDKHAPGIMAQTPKSNGEPSETDWRRMFLQRPQVADEPEHLQPGVPVSSPWTAQEAAAHRIERAYDGLHRAQALLAYLKIVARDCPNVGHLFDAAKRSYEQALSIYLKRDFSAASELAAASSGLSQAADIVISRAFRSNASSPTLVPPPPSGEVDISDSTQVQDHLLRVQKLLARVRWLLENGTMPSEDIEEAREIAAQSQIFFLHAQQMFKGGTIRDASQLAQAAEAIAYSAEHRCKKCYVAHESDSRLMATAQPPP